MRVNFGEIKDDDGVENAKNIRKRSIFIKFQDKNKLK